MIVLGYMRRYGTPEDVMQGWLNSPGHCSNIMKGAWLDVGAALYKYPSSVYTNYWTLEFAAPL